MALRLLILDCDGVLIRSERANLAYYNHLFEAFQMPPVRLEDEGRFRLLHTLSTPQVVDAFFPQALRQEALAYAMTVDFSRFVDLLEAEPGWDGVFARLKPQLSLCVATNRGASAHAVLARVGLLEYLDHVVTIRDVERPKPHPDLLLKSIDRFRVQLAEALYVGDSALDRQAARSAGIPFLGFRDGSPGAADSPEDVERCLRRVAWLGDSDSMARAHP